jgi:prolyl-tRNA synthetase
VLVRRDTGEKKAVPQEEVTFLVPQLLEEIQASLLKKAQDRLAAGSRKVDTYEDLKKGLEGEGGFLYAPWCGSPECEEKVNAEAKATIRVIPADAEECPACMICGKGPAKRVPFATSY